jgi:hypothetical protein
MGADTEAPPQARRTAEEAALDELRRDWGAVYMIGRSDEYGWWASLRGRVGVYLSGRTPDELREAMAADCAPRAGVQWGRSS